MRPRLLIFGLIVPLLSALASGTVPAFGDEDHGTGWRAFRWPWAEGQTQFISQGWFGDDTHTVLRHLEYSLDFYLAYQTQTLAVAASDGHAYCQVGTLNDGLGFYIRIIHDSTSSVYAHLDSCDVDNVDVVQGQIIGTTGSTGGTGGNIHLHFMVTQGSASTYSIPFDNMSGWAGPWDSRCGYGSPCRSFTSDNRAAGYSLTEPLAFDGIIQDKYRATGAYPGAPYGTLQPESRGWGTVGSTAKVSAWMPGRDPYGTSYCAPPVASAQGWFSCSWSIYGLFSASGNVQTFVGLGGNVATGVGAEHAIFHHDGSPYAYFMSRAILAGYTERWCPGCGDGMFYLGFPMSDSFPAGSGMTRTVFQNGYADHTIAEHKTEYYYNPGFGPYVLGCVTYATDTVPDDPAARACRPPQPTVVDPSVGSNWAALNWVDNATLESGYGLGKYNGAGWPDLGGPLPPNTTSKYDDGLLPGSYYAYWPAALNGSTHSYAGGSVTVVTPPVPAPEIVGAFGLGPNQVHIFWRDNAANEAGYEILRYDTVTGQWPSVQSIPPTSGGVTSSAVPTSQAGATNAFWIAATGGASLSYAPGYVSSAAQPLNYPAQPMYYLMDSTTTTATFSWFNATGSTSVKILKYTGASPWPVLVTLTPLAPGYIQEFTDTNLVPGQYYAYWIENVTPSGSVYAATSITVITRRTPAAPIPAFAYGMGKTSIKIGWADASADETGFTVLRYISGAWVQVGPTLPANTTSFIDTGPQAGGTYAYWIKSVGLTGETYAWAYISSSTFPP